MTLPHDTKLKAVAQMFAAMQHDWEEAAKSPSRYVGHITRTNYKPKFDVSDEDIIAYCKTLTPLTPIIPNCVMCNQPWHWYNQTHEVRPHGNDGWHIDNVDSINTFCAPKKHDTIWYRQGKNNKVSIEREIKDLNGNYFLLNWNCDCSDEKCYGKNHITLITGSHRARGEEYTTVKYFDPPIPYNISHEDLWKLIEGNMLLL